VLYTAAGLIFALALVFAVSAQDDELNTMFIFPDGVSFTYPVVFRGEMLNDIAAIYSDIYYIAVLNSEALRARGLPRRAELIDALSLDVDLVYASIDGLQINPDAVEALTLGGREAVRYRFEDAFGGGLMYAIRLSDGGIGMVYSFGTVEQPPDEALTRAVVQSFDLRSANQIVTYALQTVALDERQSLGGGVSFSYPDTWALSMTDEGALLLNNEHTLQLISRRQFEALGIEAGTLDETLPLIYAYAARDLDAPPPFDAERIRRFNLRGRSLLRYDFNPDLNTMVTILMIPFSNRTFGALIATTSGALPPTATIIAVADSFDFGSQPRPLATAEVTPEPTPELTPEPTPEATAEPTPELTPAATESAEIPLGMSTEAAESGDDTLADALELLIE
jgi:hypothetical protein